MKSKFILPIIFISIFIGVIFLIFSIFRQPNETVACKECNVILISVDALRPDHLGIYGYKRNTSPRIDELFNKGFVFQNAFSQSPNTLPSHMSMFTGLYPSTHQVMSADQNVSLSTKYKTIAEILKIYSYKTQGFYLSDHLDPKFGFARGFDNYTERYLTFQNSELFDFLNSIKKEKFFLFMHMIDLHDPYVSYPPFETMFDKDYNGKIIGNYFEFKSILQKNNLSETDSKARALYWSRVNKSDPRDIEHLIALYDSNIYRTDSFLGNFSNYLNDLGLLNNTIIIVTSDHGEEFNEHGSFLHEKLYDETIHVPLLIYVPNSKPNAIKNQVRSIDIVLTVLSIIGISQPQDIDGRSLKFLMENPNAPDSDQVLYSEFSFERAIRTPEWKFIKTVNGTVSYEFFDLKNDPAELFNLYGKGLEKEKEFKNKLENWETKMNSTCVNVEFLNSTFIGYP